MLALTAVHPISYIGVGPTGSGQIINSGLGGPASKQLNGLITVINDTTATGTTVPVGYIDGVAVLGRQVVLPFQSVSAAATINGVANQAQYFSVFGDSQFTVGQTLVTTGFTNSGNNASSVITAVGSNFVQVTNSGAVAETTATGIGAVTISSIPNVSVFLSNGVGDSTAAVVLASVAPVWASAVTTTGFTLNFKTLTTAAAQITVGCVLNFTS